MIIQSMRDSKMQARRERAHEVVERPPEGGSDCAV